jgi:hypothetical protein
MFLSLPVESLMMIDTGFAEEFPTATLARPPRGMYQTASNS